MKAYLHIGILIVSLLALASCGSDNKSKATIEISHSFSASDFSGGLVIIGSTPEGKKISISLSGTTQKTVELEKGTWTFAAVGWDGALNFAGNKLCGSTIAEIGGQEATVSLSVNATNCASAAASTLEIKNLFFGSCGIFHDYVPGTNSYSSVTALSLDDYCSSANMVQDFVSKYKFYRVFAVNSYNGSTSFGNSSSCTPLNSGTRYALPTKLMPFAIRTYRSIEECNALTAKSQSFIFPKGLTEGDVTSFGHHYSASPATDDAKIILPASMTRRGRSPFIDMMPRILCNNADCAKDALTNVTKENVTFFDWMNSGNLKKTLARNVNVTACPSSLMSASKFFRVTDCHVEDGDLVANLKRNTLTCQQNNIFSTLLDVVHKSNKIFLLDNNTVKRYSDQGEQFSGQATGGTNLALAVNELQDTFILRSGGAVWKQEFDGATSSYGPESMIVSSGAQMIEAAGNHLFVITSGNYINVINKDSGVLLSTTSTMDLFPDTAKAMVFANGFLYVLSSNTGVTISKYPINATGGIGAIQTLYTKAATTGVDLSYNSANGKLYAYYGTSYEKIDPATGAPSFYTLPS